MTLDRHPGLDDRRSLRQTHLDTYLADPALKQSFVTPMFETIAPQYDRFTRAFSYGLDKRWKAELLSLLAARSRPDMRVIDLACGTGDLAVGAARLVPEGRVSGIDLAPSMIGIAKRRATRDGIANVAFDVGDMAELSLPDESVDVVTAGYALRNAPNYALALNEIHRVLRVGGYVLTLDFYRPRSLLWRNLFLGYLAIAGNAFGWMWHGRGVVYGYIARSIEYFISHEAFSAVLEVQGFAVECVRQKLLGGVAVHVARKLG
jgi:demethylmenaquinone methyltransferase / 2-methoxy-6-polyprenyl-1,4-benzoquinol methylase